MKRMILFLLLPLLAPTLLAQCIGSGAIWNCPSGVTPTQVNAAINSSTDGAIITFAGPGTYVLSTTGAVNGVSWVFNMNHGVTLICATPPTTANGAVSDPTPLLGTSPPASALVRGAASTNACTVQIPTGLVSAVGTTAASGNPNNFFYRVSGFTFDCQTNSLSDGVWTIDNLSSGTDVIMQGVGPNHFGGVRLDHNTFKNCPFNQAITYLGSTSGPNLQVFGVVDHNYVTSANFNAINFWNGNYIKNLAYPPSQKGTFNNLFFEDNYAAYGSLANNSARGCTDGNFGTIAQVWRFNHTLDCLFAMHQEVENYEHYWNLVELDANATGAENTPGNPATINCTRCLHLQGASELTVFSDQFKIPSGNAEAGDPIVNQFYRDVAGTGNWTPISSFTVSTINGHTAVTVKTTSPPSGPYSFTNGFAFTSIKGLATSANNVPLQTYYGAFDAGSPSPNNSTTGVMYAVGLGLSTDTSTTGVIGSDANAEFPPCDGSMSNVGFAYGHIYFWMTWSDGNRTPAPSNFGYPCFHQPGRDFAGNYKPQVFVGNTFYNTGNAAHGLQESVGSGVVPNAFPPTNCGTSTTTTAVCDYSSFHSLSNREWFGNFGTIQTSPTTPWNGTFTQHAGFGAGYGKLINRPATCTQSSENAFGGNAGSMYLATDQGPVGQDGVTPMGVIYTCSSGGVWITYYTPVGYPHPLVGTSGVTATPTFSPGTGTYIGSVPPVTISSTTAGTIICYNNTGASIVIAGASSCPSGSTLFSTPVSVTFTQSLYAVAGGPGFTDSAVGKADYVFGPSTTNPTIFAGDLILNGTVNMQ